MSTDQSATRTATLGSLHAHGEVIRSHADFLASLPEGETFIREDVIEHRDLLKQLVGQGVIDRVRKETVEHPTSTSPSVRWLYKVPQEIHRGATRIVDKRDVPMPCGHAGIRNLGDGEYSCSFDGCDRRFTREEVET